MIEYVIHTSTASLEIQLPGQNVGPLPAPANGRARTLSQAVEVEFDAVKGASMYLWLMTFGLPSETSVWTETFSTKVKHTFENIPAGQVITVKLYALGPVGKGQPSDYISEMAGM